MRNIMISSLIVLFLTTACREGEMAYLEKGNPTAARKVLIAGTASEFKRDVVNRLTERLGTEEYYFKFIGLNRLDEEELDQYGAILLVARFAMGRLDGRVTDFLEKESGNKKVILFYTYGSEEAGIPEKRKPKLQVDAVSSASMPDRIKQRADELAGLIEARF